MSSTFRARLSHVFRPHSSSTRYRAATSALLGLPAPRESEGTPITPLLPLANQAGLPRTHHDVFVQRQRLAAALAKKLGVWLKKAERELLRAEAPTEPAELDDATRRLSALHAAVLQRGADADAAFATWLTCGAALVMGVGVAIVCAYAYLQQNQSQTDVPLLQGSDENISSLLILGPSQSGKSTIFRGAVALSGEQLEEQEEEAVQI